MDEMTVTIYKVEHEDLPKVREHFSPLAKLSPPSNYRMREVPILEKDMSYTYNVHVTLEHLHIIDAVHDAEIKPWEAGLKRLWKCCHDFANIVGIGSLLEIEADRNVLELRDKWVPKNERKKFYVWSHGVLADDDYEDVKGGTDVEKIERNHGKWKKDPNYWRS